MRGRAVGLAVAGMGEASTMSRRALAAVLAALLLAGCTATRTAVGVREPDLAAIQPGDPRSKVERILDDPLWRAGSADGLTYEIYQFKKGEPPAPLGGATVLFLDIFTFGLLELEQAGAHEKFGPVKQVAVAYDAEGRVRSVSAPWDVPEGVYGPCRRMRSLIPEDLGVAPTERPSPVAAPADAAAKVAVLEVDGAVEASVDGRKVAGGSVTLPPGRHRVDYEATVGGSAILGSMITTHRGSAEVELLPGRRYRLDTTRLRGWNARADLFWIEDVDSDETLYCSDYFVL